MLGAPVLAAIGGIQNGAEVANGPARLVTRKEDAMERKRLSGLRYLPRLSLVRTVQHYRTGTADDPDLVADPMDTVKIPAGPDLGRQGEIGVAPLPARRTTAGEDQAALPDGHRTLAHHLQVLDGPTARRVFPVSPGELPLPQHAQATPGAGQRAGLVILKIRGEPGCAARSGDCVPAPACVRRAKDPGRKLLGAVADCEPGPRVDKAHAIQARQIVVGAALPLHAPVAREQEYAGAAFAVRSLLTSRYPPYIGVKEMDGTQRSPNTGRLPLPVLSAVDGVPDHALIAGRPTLIGIDKMHCVQRGIVEVAQVGGGRSQSEQSAGGQCHEKGSHGFSSSDW